MSRSSSSSISRIKPVAAAEEVEAAADGIVKESYC